MPFVAFNKCNAKHTIRSRYEMDFIVVNVCVIVARKDHNLCGRQNNENESHALLMTKSCVSFERATL